MAKECTAVNALIGPRPLRHSSSFEFVDLFSVPKKAPEPRPEPKPAKPPKAAKPIAAPRVSKPEPVIAPRVTKPVVAQPPPRPVLSAPVVRARTARGTQSTSGVVLTPASRIAAPSPTQLVDRPPPSRWPIYAAAVGVLAIASAVVGYIAILRTSPTQAAPVAAVPARPPVVATPIPTATPIQPALVDVRFDSEPAGATVTLVDGVRTIVLGTTPMIAGVDPARAYQVAFASPDRPTQTATFDPRTNQHVAIVLPALEPPTVVIVDDPLPPPAPPPAKHLARAAHAHHAVAAAKPATGTGTLMISSKPPCSILIDGKATGLVTPQKAITLAAGHHQVTLVNEQAHIKKSAGVEIAPAKSTRLIRDLMH